MQWALLGDSSPNSFLQPCKKKRVITLNKIIELLLDNGACITNKDEIMAELECFYRTLFAKDCIAAPLKAPTLFSLLHIVKPILLPHEIQSLEWTTTQTKLHQTLKLIAKGKLLGIDSLTLEVFTSCWHFIEKTSSTYSFISGKQGNSILTSMRESLN